MTGSFLLLLLLVAGVGITGLLIIRYAFTRVDDIASMQKRFLADSSHEMRTPLAIMKTNIEVSLMDKQNLTREEAIEALESNLQEVDNITRIINALLHLTRLEDPMQMSPFVRIDAMRALTNAVEQCAPIAQAKNITLHLPVEIESFLQGDAQNLEILFKNLLKNAITYTQSGGTVWVRIKHIFPQRIVFEFEDNGVGIPKEKLTHIFAPFYRAKDNHELIAEENARISVVIEKSLGLGLALVERIVKKHRGTIYVESELNRGTRFFVTFPLA